MCEVSVVERLSGPGGDVSFDRMSVRPRLSSLGRRRRLGFSEAEAALHLPQPPVPRVRAAVVQPVRPAAQHQLPRRLAQPDAQVRPAAVHRPAIPGQPRHQRHPLRPEAGEHPAVQPEAQRHQDC